MATIPTPGSELRHVRKTITFDGSAGNGGAASHVTLFTVTGSVLVDYATLRVATTLDIGAADPDDTSIRLTSPSVTGPSLSLAQQLLGDEFYLGDGAGNLAATAGCSVIPGFTCPWVTSAGAALSLLANYLYVPLLLMDDLSCYVAGNDIVGGVLIVDVWYRPITDDGALAGDDIDQDSRTWTWATALSDIAAVPAITASALSGLNWLFALARNKRTQTATTETVYKDDGSTSLATSTKSDDGTTYTRGEYS